MGEERLAFAGRGAERVALDASLSAPAYLLLSVPYSPGWSATLDGQPVRLVRADLAFMAVHVPAGQHRVTFAYRPPLAAEAAIASALAALSLAVATIMPLWRRGRGKGAQGRAASGQSTAL
jgi:uncharacterized membrane protein YfhO